MEIKKAVIAKIFKDSTYSLILYSLPVIAMFAYYCFIGQQPWEQSKRTPMQTHLWSSLLDLNSWGWPTIIISIGITESILGLYKNRLRRNEMILDFISLFIPAVIVRPILVYFTIKFLPYALPQYRNIFSWVPFWWGFIILSIAMDLTDYWYHRLHHEIPFLWRFHRTHHSAPYMGVSMAFRINLINRILVPQSYLLIALSYLGVGVSALLYASTRTLITLAAHSSFKWDKPLYRIRWLNPITWVLERTISTPATHHAHHAASNDDGIGHYIGNFGSVFFIWDVIFGTGLITRKYPSEYGIRNYKNEEWYVQFFWPFLKSKKKGSELSVGGPIVGDESAETMG